jgi:hypothetical protein
MNPTYRASVNLSATQVTLAKITSISTYACNNNNIKNVHITGVEREVGGGTARNFDK